jgi:hypothetical protein
MQLREKLERYRRRLVELEGERRDVLEVCIECREVRTLARELDAARTKSGITEAEHAVAALLSNRGRASSTAGEGFEVQARRVVEECVAPDVTSEVRNVRILSGVKLGAARVELDHVVIREPPERTAPVEVLAIVEAKRNINDLAHGLRLRRENIAWLSGASDGYDPSLYRTHTFASGHFDRAARHDCDDGAFIFDRTSFERFRSSDDIPMLHLITRSGPIWGMSAAALARLSWRVATDPVIDDSDEALGRLLAFAHGLAKEEETPDVLRAYLRDPERARRIVLV